MIARQIRWLWLATIVFAAGAAWMSVRCFSGLAGPWFAAVATIAAIAALHPVAIALCFAMSRVFGDPVPPEFRLSPWRAIKTWDAEIDASMRGFWFATPFLEHRPTPQPSPGAPARGFALLFLHGYFCNRAVWHSFMKDAASRGFRCEAVTLDEGHASIDSHAAVVGAAIERLVAGGAERVVLIGHSMGGLVARACLRIIDGSRVAHVFTLGSPHRGTHSARYAGGKPSLLQMRRDSPWLDELAAHEMDGRGLPRAAFTTIFSYHDDIVYPQATACLDGAERVAIGGCGHVSLLYDHRVRKIVFDRIDALEARGQAGTGVAAS